MNQHNRLKSIQLFHVTELEERFEFKGWGGYVEGGSSEANGPTVSVGITKSF